MARSRSLPTMLFRDPDFFDLSSDTQVILVGLVLGADDAGRELAHVALLARELNKDVVLIEQALTKLSEAGMLQCYQVGKRTYYQLTHWQEWETLSKPTPSKYPAPPAEDEEQLPEIAQDSPGKPRKTRGISGKPRISPPEEEGEKEEEREDEGEGEHRPPNVVTFSSSTPSDDTGTASLSETEVKLVTHKVASILKLDVDDALIRIVMDYCHDPSLSLLGEADAAREWIDDPKRNRKGQRLTPAFFRRWLKREHEDALRRHALRATGATEPGSHPPACSNEKVRGAEPDDPYAAFLARRIRAVAQASSPIAEAGGAP